MEITNHSNRSTHRESGDPYGIRTRVAAVKGQCPRPLDEGVIVERGVGVLVQHREIKPRIFIRATRVKSLLMFFQKSRIITTKSKDGLFVP